MSEDGRQSGSAARVPAKLLTSDLCPTLYTDAKSFFAVWTFDMLLKKAHRESLKGVDWDGYLVTVRHSNAHTFPKSSLAMAIARVRMCERYAQKRSGLLPR